MHTGSVVKKKKPGKRICTLTLQYLILKLSSPVTNEARLETTDIICWLWSPLNQISDVDIQEACYSSERINLGRSVIYDLIFAEQLT